MATRRPSSTGLTGLAVALAALALQVPTGAGATAAAAIGDLELLTHGRVLPNVMLLLDNSLSMRDPLGASTRIQVAGTTLVNLINAVYPSDGAGGYDPQVRLGLTIFDPTGGRAGGLVSVPIADNNKTALINAVNARVTAVLGTQPGTGTLLSEALVDVGRYYAGQWGFGSYPAVANTSPMDLSCRKSFIVFITDGEPNDDRNNHHGVAVAGTTAYSAFVNLIGNADGDADECSLPAPATCIDAPGTGRDDGIVYPGTGTDWMDDVTYFLYRRDLVPDKALNPSGVDGLQNVTTYTIGFTVDHPLLSDAALNGGGQYYTANDSAGLATYLTAAVNDIIEQTTASFTSAVVPTSQTRFGSGFYNAFFESSQAPVWAGHLEAYRLAPDGEVQDANLDPVLDGSGELLPTRVPFWDAAEQLAANASRALYTTKAGARVDFDATNVLEADLGILAAELPVYPNYPASGVDTLPELRTAIVGYLHGRDAFDEDGDSNATELRPVVLGDIFHSTPQVVGPPSTLLLHEPGYRDYRNLYAGRDRVVYAGANDGVFHAFDAGSYYTGDDGSTPETENGYYSAGSGGERFGYVPGALLSRVKLVPRNSPRSQDFADGSPAAADVWLGDGGGSDVSKSADEWATVLVTGYREGGSGYLALDVTDPDAGASDPHGPYPALLWEFTHAKLANSWSEPVITRVKLRGPVGAGDHCGPDDGDGDCLERWVAIFGGGYAADGDPNRTDYKPAGSASWSDASKAIFMVALDSGALLASVEYDASGVAGPDDMVYALPATPAVLDLDFDGFADVVYLGDLGGQLWKWDVRAVGADNVGDSRVDNWAAGVFFRTDPVAVGAANHHRSFFFPPSATYLSGKLVLAFGSGERHDLIYLGDPVASENNRFYVVRDDYPTGASAFPELGDGDLTDVTGSDVDGNATDYGYYFQVADGEKFVTEFTIFAGYAIAASFTPVPSADLCETAGGQGFLYALRLASGEGYFADPSAPPSEDRRIAVGGGLPSRPRITLGQEADGDVIWVKTSKGRILSFQPPPRNVPLASMLYWRQRF